VKKVYLLASGQYSDYGVHAAFPTKKLAKAAVKVSKVHGRYMDDARVETLHLYDAIPEPVTDLRLSVVIWDDGATEKDIESYETDLPWALVYGPPPSRPSVTYTRAPIHRNMGGRLGVRGGDLQAVRQAFSDAKAQVLHSLATTGTPGRPVNQYGW